MLFCPLFLLAQENVVTLPKDTIKQYNAYEKDLLPASFFKKNRDALRQLMPTNSVAVFFASPIKNRSNDVDYEYHQNPNFYYLSGLCEPHAVLLIFKEKQHFDDFDSDEILFIQKQNEIDAKWTGETLGEEGAENYLGINKALKNDEFLTIDLALNKFSSVLITQVPEDVKNTSKKADLYNIVNAFNLKTKKLNNVENSTLPELMAKLRQVKSDEEIALLKKAINMTCDAQIELMKSITPSMTEYQTEAIVEYVFKKNGAEYPGFPSILGSGENSCVVHYNSNRKKLNSKDLLVSDVGAEYHGYTADVARTIPVSGKFSEEEKIIYNIVLKAQKAGIEACKPGSKFWQPHREATKIITKGLIDLGIVEHDYDVQKYFMHGTSHYLGLDVHDAGLHGRLEKGNVLTVEPGIYIPEGSNCDPKWWNIGIRIEDDILITETGNENLSAKAPREIEEIEALMKEEGSFK